MQVVRDVVGAGAGADHQHRFSGDVEIVAVAAGMQDRAAEIFGAFEFRNVRQAADAHRHHDVARMHGAGAAVGELDLRVPAALRVVVAAAEDGGAGPDVELHRLGVELEPVGELVLRDVDRPVVRERHVRKVVHADFVVQLQGAVALAPDVADALAAVDHERVDVHLAKPRRHHQPGLAGADHQHVGVARWRSRRRPRAGRASSPASARWRACPRGSGCGRWPAGTPSARCMVVSTVSACGAPAIAARSGGHSRGHGRAACRSG